MEKKTASETITDAQKLYEEELGKTTEIFVQGEGVFQLKKVILQYLPPKFSYTVIR